MTDVLVYSGVMKKCTRCKIEKPADQFGKDPRNKDGMKSYCRPCYAAFARERYALDPERHRATVKRNRNRDPEYVRGRHLRNVYGLTPSQHAAILAAQGGVCAICGTDQPGGKTGTWHTDHDHATKKVRGILCHSCNIGLGHFGDSVDRLLIAVEYLRKHA